MTRTNSLTSLPIIGEKNVYEIFLKSLSGVGTTPGILFFISTNFNSSSHYAVEPRPITLSIDVFVIKKTSFVVTVSLKAFLALTKGQYITHSVEHFKVATPGVKDRHRNIRLD